jgi:catechol 2,3-dioxygenase-like lactoylglutathione lyase family enzyme
LNPARTAAVEGWAALVLDCGWFTPIHFNHLAVAAKDKQHSATFLTRLLGLPEPAVWGPFLSVTLDDGVRLDYAEPGVEFPGQHYALLVTDDVFDRAIERIRADGVPFWADPGMRSPSQINTITVVGASTSTIRPATISS